MAYIPANPNYAVVNCKIGDLNLTPIPPDALESFTYERDTSTGGNKFTIVVHDETAIVMESYLAEAMAKAKASQSYDFDLDPLEDLGEVDMTDYADEDSEESEEGSEESDKEESDKEESGGEPEAASYATRNIRAFSLSDNEPTLRLGSPEETNAIGSSSNNVRDREPIDIDFGFDGLDNSQNTNKLSSRPKIRKIDNSVENNSLVVDSLSTSMNNALQSTYDHTEASDDNTLTSSETVSAESLKKYLKHPVNYYSSKTKKKFSSTNETSLKSGETETTNISGGTGVTTTDILNMRITEGSPVKPNVIDDSKLHYADPSTGLRTFLGKIVPEDVWISEGAITEFTGGFDPSAV